MCGASNTSLKKKEKANLGSWHLPQPSVHVLMHNKEVYKKIENKMKA